MYGASSKTVIFIFYFIKCELLGSIEQILSQKLNGKL